MLHSVGLDALATTNDMNRNVLCTSNPYESRCTRKPTSGRRKISELHLLPRTRAYAEIWLDKERSRHGEEPILTARLIYRVNLKHGGDPPQERYRSARQRHELCGDCRKRQAGGRNLLVGGGLSIESTVIRNLHTLVPRASLLSAAGAHHGGGRR